MSKLMELADRLMPSRNCAIFLLGETSAFAIDDLIAGKNDTLAGQVMFFCFALAFLARHSALRARAISEGRRDLQGDVTGTQRSGTTERG